MYKIYSRMLKSTNGMANNMINLHENSFKNLVSIDKLCDIKERLFKENFNNFENFVKLEENKTYIFKLGNISFESLDKNTLDTMFKDGRIFSHFSEHWLEDNCPILKHVTGCKDHDFVNKVNQTQYDAKTWTARKLDFRPSNMLGKGRTFDKEIFDKKCNKLTYIIISNVDFPEIKVKFIKGCDLIKLYPKGYVYTNEEELNKFFS
mgnify:FL=1